MATKRYVDRIRVWRNAVDGDIEDVLSEWSEYLHEHARAMGLKLAKPDREGRGGVINPRRESSKLVGKLRGLSIWLHRTRHFINKGDAAAAAYAAFELGVVTASIGEKIKRHAGGRRSSATRGAWKDGLRQEADGLASAQNMPLDKIFYQLAEKYGKGQSTIRNAYYSHKS